MRAWQKALSRIHWAIVAAVSTSTATSTTTTTVALQQEEKKQAKQHIIKYSTGKRHHRPRVLAACNRPAALLMPPKRWMTTFTPIGWLYCTNELRCEIMKQRRANLLFSLFGNLNQCGRIFRYANCARAMPMSTPMWSLLISLLDYIKFCTISAEYWRLFQVIGFLLV